MALSKLYNLARVTTATTGTGTITLGSAVSGFLSFSAAGVQDGDLVAYGISDGANSECGTGTYTASGTTLTRSVTQSTNSNSAISLSGSAQVFVTALAPNFPLVDRSSGTNTILYGGTSAGSTLSLRSTTNGSPSGDLVELLANGTAVLQAQGANGGVVTIGRGAFTPYSGSFLEVRTGTDQRFSVGTHVGLSSGIAFQTFNDAINANVPMEIRASQVNMTQSGLAIGNIITDAGLGNILATGTSIIKSSIAIPAGGTAGTGYMFSATANFGIFFGSGAPSLAAAKGSLYLRSDGTQTNRLYINTDGSTTWTAFNTTA